MLSAEESIYICSHLSSFEQSIFFTCCPLKGAYNPLKGHISAKSTNNGKNRSLHGEKK
jgi:hypothetical protein